MPSAVVWSNVGGTGLFDQIGKITKWVNLLDVSEKNEFTDPLAALDATFVRNTPEQSTMASAFDSQAVSWSRSLRANKQQLVGLVDGVLRYHLSALGIDLNNTVREDLLDLLVKTMILDTQTIDASTLTTGIASAVALRPDGTANKGNPTLIGAFNVDDFGQTAENLWGDVYYLDCTSGYNESNGGSASFDLKTASEASPDTVYASESGTAYFAYGTLNSLRVLSDTDAINSNGALGDWNIVNEPVSWIPATGIAGVDFSEETVTTYRGLACMKVKPTLAAAAYVVLTQDVTSALQPNTTYALFFRGRMATGSGDFNLNLRVVNAAAATVGTVDTTQASYTVADTWYPFSATFKTPEQLSTSYTLEIMFNNVSGTVAAFIEDALLLPVTNVKGLNLALVTGNLPAYKGDQIHWTVANNYAGVFQKFFGRFFERTLPYNAGGTESIDDALAS